MICPACNETIKSLPIGCACIRSIRSVNRNPCIMNEIIKIIPQLLEGDESSWNTLHVKKPFPQVERLWKQWKDYRISLHRIQPCSREDALYQPHPWPQLIYIAEGSYSMGIGYGNPDNLPPPIATTLELGPGTTYEMNDPFGWHYVAPKEIVWSVMITGKPWEQKTIHKKEDYILSELSDDSKFEIIDKFKKIYLGC